MSINVSPVTKFSIKNDNSYSDGVGAGIFNVLGIFSKGPFYKPDEVISSLSRFEALYGREVVPDGTVSNVSRVLSMGGRVRISRVAPLESDGSISGIKTVIRGGTITSDSNGGYNVSSSTSTALELRLYNKSSDTNPVKIKIQLTPKDEYGGIGSLSEDRAFATLVRCSNFVTTPTAELSPGVWTVRSYNDININSNTEEVSNYILFNVSKLGNKSTIDGSTVRNFINNSDWNIKFSDSTSGTDVVININKFEEALSLFNSSTDNKVEIVSVSTGASYPNAITSITSGSNSMTCIPLYCIEGTLVEADYGTTSFVGNQLDMTGFYSFDDYDDAYTTILSHLWQHMKGDTTKLSAIYNAGRTWVEGNQNCELWVELPKSKLSSDGNQEPCTYEDHVSNLNSLSIPPSKFMAAFTGGWVIPNQLGEFTDSDTLGTVMGIQARYSNNPWNSLAGEANGIVADARGIVSRNYGSAGQYNNLQVLAENAINTSVVKTLSTGVKSALQWHNYTLMNDNTSFRFLSNVYTVIYLKKNIKPIYDSKFEMPNTFSTWREMYYQVKEVLDAMVAGEAIFNYEYVGDQFATQLSELKLNNEADVRAGKYKVKIKIWDIVKLQLIEVEISVERASRTVSITI